MNRAHLYAPNVLKMDDGRLIASQRMLFRDETESYYESRVL